MLVLIVLGLGLMFGCQTSGTAAAEVDTKAVSDRDGHTRTSADAERPALPAGTMTAELMVEGVSCASCDLGLRRNLRKLGGVVRIREGSTKQHLLVDFLPDELASDRIIEAVYDSGYSAEVLVRDTES